MFVVERVNYRRGGSRNLVCGAKSRRKRKKRIEVLQPAGSESIRVIHGVWRGVSLIGEGVPVPPREGWAVLQLLHCNTFSTPD